VFCVNIGNVTILNLLQCSVDEAPLRLA